MMSRGGFMADIPVGVKNLLIANVVIFIASSLLERSGVNVTSFFGLHLIGSAQWGVWQYITGMFMHGGISHLFFNMFALYMFGRILEQVWGTKRFIIYYMVCGIGAGLINNLVSWYEFHQILAPCEAFLDNETPDAMLQVVQHADVERLGFDKAQLFTFIDQWQANISDSAFANEALSFVNRVRSLYAQIMNITTTIGASGAIFGILLAFGMLFPNTEMYIMFIPIPIKAKYFVAIYAFIELFAGVQQFQGDNIAHFAHLGGMLVGFIMLKIWRMRRNTFY